MEVTLMKKIIRNLQIKQLRMYSLIKVAEKTKKEQVDKKIMKLYLIELKYTKIIYQLNQKKKKFIKSNMKKSKN